jgi:hypothetical protein
MPIYRANGISDADGDFCEIAIAANRFDGHGIDEEGAHVLSLHADGKAYVVKVEVQKVPGLRDGLIIRAVYPVAPSGIDELVADLI